MWLQKNQKKSTKIKFIKQDSIKNIENIFKNYELIIDGSDNFETKF